MSKNEQMKIAPVEALEREDWDDLQAWQDRYSEAELVEMLHRYMDAQVHAKNYRQKAALKAKATKAAIEAKAQAMGMSVEEFLAS